MAREGYKTITVSDEIINQIKSMPDYRGNLSEYVRELVDERSQPAQKTTPIAIAQSAKQWESKEIFMLVDLLLNELRSRFLG